MITRAFLVGLLLAVGVTATDRVAACGDKYLSLGLGTRFDRSPAERRAAAVLLFAAPGTDLSRTLAALSVEDGLKKAGYQPTVATTTAQFDAELRRRNWDVIVLDGRDSDRVSQRVAKPVGPRLVPVLAQPTKEELKQARKTYEIVLAAPSKNRVFVEAVDDALDLHEIDALAAAKAARKH
jgi:hypothetical protein